MLVSNYCSLPVKFVTVKCRPLYLPQEFLAVIILVVYTMLMLQTRQLNFMDLSVSSKAHIRMDYSLLPVTLTM